MKGTSELVVIYSLFSKHKVAYSDRYFKAR